MADRPNPEPLARVLRSVGVEIGYAGADTYRTVVAERILADPGPLLAALDEAGVLKDQSRVRIAMVYDGDEPVDRVLITERRYVTEWSPDARP